MNTSDKAAWLAEHLLYWTEDLTATDEKHLLSGNGMLEIIEAMTPPFEIQISDQRGHQGRPDWYVGIEKYAPSHKFFHAEDDTLPTAVIEAAYAALNAENVKPILRKRQEDAG